VTDKKLRSGEDSIVQKQAGKAVQERQTRFRRISAITSDIAYSCHTLKSGRFSLDWIAGAAERITGYSTQEIRAHRSLRFLVVEEDIPLFEKNVIGLTPGSRGSCELRIRHKNGNVVWVSSFAECVAAAKIPGRLLYGGLAEITERKQVEEKLSASETRYRRLFEAAKDGILILDADTGMIMDVNPFLTEMLGFSREEFLGKHIWDLGFFKGIVANEADFLKLRQKEYIRYEDVALEAADGRRINVEFVSNLYPVGQGKVIQCSLRHAHLASFPAQNPYPVVEVEIDGAVRFANPAALATLTRLGLDPDVRQFLPGAPADLVLLRSHCERNPQTDELPLGGEIFVRVVTAPPGSDTLHVYLVDITERKQVEEELRESKKLLSETEKTAHIGGWVFDAEKLTQKWTEETFRILEIDVTKGEPKVPEGVDFIAPAFRPMAEQGIRRALEFGEPYDQEWEIITAKGNRRWVRAVAKAYQEQGKTKRVSGSFQDITERKRMETNLQEARKMAERYLSVAAEVILGLDPQGNITLLNDSGHRLLGYAPGELIGKNWFDTCLPEEARTEVHGVFAKLMDGQYADVQIYENSVITRNGNRLDLLWHNTLLRDTDGRIVGALSSAQDITERKQAEAQLRQSQKMEAIGQLAGGIAHDFNNLLTGILGNIAIMRSDLPSSDPLVANLSAVDSAARQAAALTKGLLTFSRREAVLPMPINLTTALEATLALLKQSLPATINIVRDYEQTAWNVLMDQSQFMQILLNLGVNAHDAMNGKGTLTIGRRNEVVEEKYVQAHPYARTGEFVHLSVTDTGSGMSAEVMRHLFEPFYTTKPVGSGTGLGLAIVYGAVKQAGGWITVTSTEGVGTTFDIYVPRCLEDSVPLLAPASVPLDVGSGTILVVEDEPIVCAVAQALLSKSGYTVMTAPDGASALNALREHPTDIDLILLDMTMPGMTTDEIVQAMRTLNSTVRILLTSGYTPGDTVNRMLEERSVQGFLAKPYTLAELAGKVQELLHGS